LVAHEIGELRAIPGEQTLAFGFIDTSGGQCRFELRDAVDQGRDQCSQFFFRHGRSAAFGFLALVE